MRKMYKILMIVMIGIITLSTIVSAVPYKEWEKTFSYGPTLCISEFCVYTIPKSVEQTKDEGYILAGNYDYEIWDNSIDPPTVEDHLFYGWLIKTDNKGNKKWTKLIGSKDQSYPWDYYIGSAEQTVDGGYIVAGLRKSRSNFYDNRIVLIKTDSLGTQQWIKVLTDYTTDYFYLDANTLISKQTKDGGYILIGTREKYSGTPISRSLVLIRTDSAGNKKWQKIMPERYGIDVQQTSDGGYMLSCETTATSPKGCIIKTDSIGNKQWEKTFEGHFVKPTKDGGYISINNVPVSTTNYDIVLIKSTSSGTTQWKKTFGGTSDDLGNKVRQTADGGYIIIGKTSSNSFIDTDGLVIKTDTNGNLQWKKNLGRKNIWGQNSQDEFYTGMQTKDEGYILLGSTQPDSETDTWLVKFSSDSTNLLKNPGFEEIINSLPKYWTKSQTGTKAIFTYPEPGRVGGKSVSIKYATKETGKVALWQQSVLNVEPLKNYKLSGYMKLEGVTGGGIGPRYNGASLRVNWYRSDGTLTRIDVITKSGTIGWSKYEQILTAPEGVVKATIGGDLYNSAGKVWYDDLSFVRVN